MRIGIDFRFLTLSRSGLDRGIPRFTQEQLQSVLTLDTDNSYLLLCEAGVDFGAIRPEILSAPNVQVVCAPGDGSAGTDERILLERFSEYQRWLEGLRLDLYHATCPVWTNHVVLPGFDVCPYVATAYDLIPLLYPAQYLHGDEAHAVYEHKLLFLRQATRIAAISLATAADLVTHLGVAEDRIDVTLPAPSAAFRPLPPAVTRAILDALDHPSRSLQRRRVRIPLNYVLCIAGMHYTKNPTTLITAYAELPRSIRTRIPLVIAGGVTDHEAEALAQLANQHGIVEQVVLTGRVSDDELAALYNGATIMVHPSHYEGFGLPVAEAMRCGAAVITTSRSALPEVAGDAALLVDSDNTEAFTEAIELLLRDGALREELGRRGVSRSARFNAEALGRATLGCYSQAATPAPMTRKDAVRVALWSPVPPQYSGISDYTDDLVTALAEEPGLKLRIFVDDGVLPPVHLMRAADVHHWSDFERCARHAPFDVIIYQLGASPFHLYMEGAMTAHPGVVVLHDLQWSRALLHDRLGRQGGEDEFRRELAALEGEAAAREWDRLRLLPSRAGTDAERAFLDEHLMLGSVVESATVCVALTPEAQQELARRHPRARLSPVIPMGVRDPERDGLGFDRATARAFLGLDRESFLVIVPGIADPAKHIASVLEAFVGLREAGVDAQLAIVGRIPDSGYEAELRAHITRLGVSGVARVTGHVPRIVFEAYTAACDAVVVLRDRGLRQMSAVAMRALAARRCLVVSDLPTFSSIPDSVCLKVPAPPEETAVVSRALIGLAADRGGREDLERRARAYYETSARLAPMVDGYVRLIREQVGRCDDAGLRPVGPTHSARGQPDDAIRYAPSGRPVARPGPLGYSKVCELEDFANPELRSVIRDVASHKRAAYGPDFPRGHEYRKDWEIAMAVRTLDDHGVLRPDARVLGVAAGSEDTVFYLTRHVGEVVAVDRYLDPGDWTDTAPTLMITDPERIAPFSFRRERLTVQHMDARILGFGDESFDGIFSSGSIEHFGDLQTIAAAAYEMGRVLKRGGILTLSTEMLITPQGDGSGVPFPGTMLLSPRELQRYIVDASGLEPVDALDTTVSHWTRATVRDITVAINDHHGRLAAQTSVARRPEWTFWDTPHIVMALGDKQFTSVHLALRRATVHPVVDNAWARPSSELRAAAAASSVTTEAHSPGLGGNGLPRVAQASPLSELRTVASATAAAEARLSALRAEIDAGAVAVERALQDAAMPRAGVYRTGVNGRTPRTSELRAAAVGMMPAADGSRQPPPGAVVCRVVSPLTPPYSVVVDPDSTDVITMAYLAGNGPGINASLLSLILALVRAGGTVVDLGANIGSISLPVAAAGRRVLSVEVAPLNLALLNAGMSLSGVGDRLRVAATAVGDHVGEASFIPRGPHGQLVDADFTGAVRVPLTTVDALLDAERIERVDLIKIDVEGAEIDVLRGMSRTAQRTDAPYLMVECCPHTLAAYGHTTTELIAQLEEYGYVTYTIDGRRLIRRRREEVQVTTVTDVIAVKGGIHRLAGYRVEPPLSRDELVARLVAESISPNPDCRASVARSARELRPDVLELPVVLDALTRLRGDSESSVRAAAAWWRDRRAGAGPAS